MPHHYHTALITVAVAAVAFSIWKRRYTLTSIFERGITLSLIMHLMALVLLSPVSTPIVGAALHRVTGRWNVDDLLGGFCLIGASTGSFFGAAIRRMEPHEVQRMFTRWIEKPLTLAVPLMVACFWMSPKTNRRHESLLLIVHPDSYMCLFFLVTILILGHIGLLAVRQLMHLYRIAPQSRHTVRMYLVSYMYAELAMTLQIGVAYLPALRQWNGHGALVWTLLCACTTTAAIGSIWSWHNTLRPWRGLIRVTGARL